MGNQHAPEFVRFRYGYVQPVYTTYDDAHERPSSTLFDVPPETDAVLHPHLEEEHRRRAGILLSPPHRMSSRSSQGAHTCHVSIYCRRCCRVQARVHVVAELTLPYRTPASMVAAMRQLAPPAEALEYKVVVVSPTVC